MHGLKDVFKVEYNDPQNLPQSFVVFLLFEPTRSAIYGSTKIDYHKWPTVLVDEVEENSAISRHVCVDHCILL